MLEVCPLIATDKPKLEVHFLGIGIRKQQTARLVFTSKTEQKQPTSYAVRPQHRRLRPLAYSDQNNMLKVRNYLNIAFMLLAIVGVILWTQLEESRNIAYIVLIVGVVLKIAEVCIRLFKK